MQLRSLVSFSSLLLFIESLLTGCMSFMFAISSCCQMMNLHNNQLPLPSAHTKVQFIFKCVIDCPIRLQLVSRWRDVFVWYLSPKHTLVVKCLLFYHRQQKKVLFVVQIYELDIFCGVFLIKRGLSALLQCLSKCAARAVLSVN